MEPRCLLSVNPIDLGVVYIEQDAGTDVRGDLFEITWTGGEEGTELTRIVIDGDQNINGFGVGDVFFDTLPTGLGADEASDFDLGAHGGIDGIVATVEDGGTRLVLEFEGFNDAERLLFEIDVDEVEDFEETEDFDATQAAATDLEIVNEGFDPITSGVEFQGSLLTAQFAAPRHFDLEGTAEFRNRYDDNLVESGLDLPADNAGEQRDRTAAAFLLGLEQEPLPASIEGKVYHDRNNDGVRDEGEEGIANVLISLVDENGIIVDVALTDENGCYKFDDVEAGTYSIVETQPEGFLDGIDTPGMIDESIIGTAINPGDTLEQITIRPGDEGVEFNFGEFLGAEINGRVQQSTRDGECFGDEEDHEPVEGAIVQLLDANGNVIQETMTDANGEYAFVDLPPGDYGLREITPDGFVDGGAQAGTVDGQMVGSVDSMGDIQEISLDSGEVAEDFNFCELMPAMLAGTVFEDTNGDGIQDPGEAGIAGVEIQLLDDDGNLVQTVFTDENGNYKINDIEPGNYMLREIQPEGFSDGIDSVGDVNGETNGELDPGGDKINDIMLGWGDTGTNFDFGEQRPGSISGRVHADMGLLDCEFNPEEGDEGLEGVLIELIDEDGSVVASTTTDANGEYTFAEVDPGDYSIRQTQPDDYFDNRATAGSAGGDVSGENIISAVTVGSGEDVVDNNFCEIPSVELSGFVFQDGEAVDVAFGETLPERIADVRSGERTSDDTFLPGVTLELRDGTAGTSLNTAEFALDGIYSDDIITTTTDENGFYEFVGIRPGTYAVYEQQPEGFVDGVDTPGSTDGIVFNPGEPIQQSALLQLSVDPQNDGIVRITVAPGQQSVENNFSEVLVNQLAEPPTLPPIVPPPFTPPATPTPPGIGPGTNFTNNNPFPAAAGAGGYSPGLSGAIATTEKPRSWHLSIINGGQPRRAGDANIADSIWLSSGRAFSDSAVTQGEWLIGNGYGDAASAGTSQVLFGLPGGFPFAGDFDGDGYDEIGVYAEGEWFIDINGNGRWDSDDLWAKLGNRRDHPVTGDWDGDGKWDIGIYGREWKGDAAAVAAEPGLPDEENRTFDEKKNVPPRGEDAAERKRVMRRGQGGALRADVVDHTFRFGRKADYPITGDWNGDGIYTIGIFRDGLWRLDVDGDGRLSSADKEYAFGQEGDTPLVGDFDGDGIDDLAVFRAGVVIVDSNRNGEIDSSDRRIQVGQAGDIPVVGDFDGDGVDEIVIYRPGGEPQSIVYQARKAS